jgi:hypothetical protein
MAHIKFERKMMRIISHDRECFESAFLEKLKEAAVDQIEINEKVVKLFEDKTLENKQSFKKLKAKADMFNEHEVGETAMVIIRKTFQELKMMLA